jgi:hypothetical protein
MPAPTSAAEEERNDRRFMHMNIPPVSAAMRIQKHVRVNDAAALCTETPSGYLQFLPVILTCIATKTIGKTALSPL